jgi:hypothetical protein
MASLLGGSNDAIELERVVLAHVLAGDVAEISLLGAATGNAKGRISGRGWNQGREGGGSETRYQRWQIGAYPHGAEIPPIASASKPSV